MHRGIVTTPTDESLTTTTATTTGPWEIDAVVFDMDGVVTDTATMHARCWKRVFDQFLRTRSEANGLPFKPFELSDYLHFVDGKPRYDGVASFLASRGISLAEGSPSDPPGYGSVCSLGNLKDQEFRARRGHQGRSAVRLEPRLHREGAGSRSEDRAHHIEPSRADSAAISWASPICSTPSLMESTPINGSWPASLIPPST